MLGLALACFALTAPAQARKAKKPSATQEGVRDEQTLQHAAELLAQAAEALDRKELAIAQGKLVESYQQNPVPEVLFQLGRLALAEDRLLDAYDLYRRYLADPNLETSDGSKEQKEARRLLEKPPPPSGQLSILGERGALVRVDGRLVGALPLSRSLLISPAEHRIELVRGRDRLEDSVRTPVGRAAELRANFASKALVLTLLPGVMLSEYYAGVTPEERYKLEQALEQAIQAARLSPLKEGLATETGTSEKPAACDDASRCQLERARKLEADLILKVQVKKQPPAQWNLALDLIDVAMGESAAKASAGCPGCKAELAADTLAKLFQPLSAQASARGRGKLEVRSLPPSADVFLDGRSLGKAPVAVAAWSGSRELVLRLPTFAEERRSIEIADGQTTSLEVQLSLPQQPVPIQPATTKEWRRAKRPLWRIIAGSLIAGTGLLLAGQGILGIAINGQPATLPDGTEGFYSSGTLGTATLVGGLLMIGSGIAGAAAPGPKQLVDVPIPAATSGTALSVSF